MPSLLDQLDEVCIDGSSTIGRLLLKAGVPETPEVHRVFALPRREPISPELVERVSAIFRAPGGQQTLFPQQAEALYVLARTRAFAPIPVGDGKTLISALVAESLGLQGDDVLLLVPGGLVEKTIAEFDAYEKHWRIRRPRVEGYEKLGRGSLNLTEIAPKAIIADEAQYLKNLKSSRTKKVVRYMEANPETIFLPMSGTMTSKSLMDYWHLALWALKDRAPVPRTHTEAERWARAVDNRVDPALRLAPGALEVFGDFPAFVSSTEGVVPGSPSSVRASISLTLDRERVRTSAIANAMACLNDGMRPDLEPLTPEGVVACKFQVEMGFYYKEKGTPPPLWRERRGRWNSLVRSIIDAGLADTELEARNKYGTTTREGQDWLAIKDSFKSIPEPVWLDEGIIPALIERAGPDCLVWVWHSTAVEDLVARGKLPVPYFGEMGKDKNGRYIESVRGTVALSIQSNRTGRNLQYGWSRNYLTYTPGSWDYWEQLMGRTHRTGTEADTVDFVVYCPTASFEERLRQAKADAKHNAPLTSSTPKLLLADEMKARVGASEKKRGKQ